MLDPRERSRSARADRWRSPVLALAALAVAFWAASYSWMLGLTPPTRWLSATASPWLVMEVAAVGTGAVALLAGLLLARAGDGSRRVGIRAAWLGGFALVATTASLAAPL
ncbi:hypothetical protein ACI792_00755 [Blastococcus sp. SYSU DS0669]